MSSIIIRPPPHVDSKWQTAEEDTPGRIGPDPFPYLAPFLTGAILDAILMGVVWGQLVVWREHYAEKESRRVKVLAVSPLLTAPGVLASVHAR
jgi:DUF2075 family protein